jgi:phosphatidylglycerophosphate synthase
MGAREVYLKTRKIPDLFWNLYVCRPPAAVLVAALAGTRVTPNQITLSAVVVALVSVLVLLFVPGYLGTLTAIVIFQVSYVLDCADGMLARWRGIQSTAGHLLDFLMDEIKAFLLLAAVAVRLYLDHADVRFLLVGLFGLVALATGIALTTFTRRPEIAPPRAEGVAAAPVRRSLVGRALSLIERAAKFVIHYPSYILFAALAGHLEAYFLPYVAVNALYAAKAFLGVSLRFGRS